MPKPMIISDFTQTSLYNKAAPSVRWRGLPFTVTIIMLVGLISNNYYQSIL